jgi:YggT family protein
MVVLASFFDALATVCGMVLWLYLWVIVARAVISWVNPDPYNPIVQALYKLTEPVLYPIRRRMGGYGLGIDFSPLVAWLLVYFLYLFLDQALRGIATQFR